MKHLLNSILILIVILTTICMAETPSGFSAKIFPMKAVNTGDPTSEYANLLKIRGLLEKQLAAAGIPYDRESACRFYGNGSLEDTEKRVSDRQFFSGDPMPVLFAGSPKEWH